MSPASLRVEASRWAQLSARTARARAIPRSHLGSNSRTATRPTDLSLSGCASAQDTVRRNPSLGVSPSATAARAPSGDPLVSVGKRGACPGSMALVTSADIGGTHTLRRCTRHPHGLASAPQTKHARCSVQLKRTRGGRARADRPAPRQRACWVRILDRRGMIAHLACSPTLALSFERGTQVSTIIHTLSKR